ncbi:MAG TPA: asparagine synthase (glutamine-hydrolyzing) [Blastocatellia bacterium]|jgi:asparagine synthase (glutamine-hydrolysing)
MCGIAGAFVTEPGRFDSRLAVEKAMLKITHRGPDDQGLFASADGRCALAHTRLSILDLSPAGHQPMSTRDGRFWVVFNGEIYNFHELRRELIQSGETFDSHSDTEVLLRLYSLYGADSLRRLRGMFAFAVWDERKQELFIARDRLGIKPLYYYAGDGKIIFASEVRAILATESAPRQIDPVALNDYLAYQSIPSPRTLIKDVKSLPPGSWMLVSASGATKGRKYWDLLQDLSTEAADASPSAVLSRTGELLREAVELHLVSDAPVGAFLSGGIDSSAVVALMSEMGHTPRTFSVIFGESNYDESVYARQVAERFGSEHTEIRLTEASMLEQLPNALAAMDQPTGDGVNTYVVSRAVREAGVKVALSGLGGDEFFAGYPSFLRLEKALKYLAPLRRLPPAARNAAARMVELAGGGSVQAAKAASMIGGDGSLASMYPVVRQVLSRSKRRSLLSGKWKQIDEAWRDPYVDLLRDAYQSAGPAELFALISYAEGRTYMHDVLLRDTDQMSMAHALEARVPLLDHKLVEYVMGTPDAYKRPNGVPKSLLVRSLGDLLPHDIVHRPKRGFTLPFADWMRGDLRNFCEERLDSRRIGSRGIFDAGEVNNLWRSFLDGSREVSWSRVWILVALEEWIEQNQAQCSI